MRTGSTSRITSYNVCYTKLLRLSALEADHDFLLKGDVFTQDVIDMWLDYKRENEVDPIRMRPVPLEFSLYFDC